MSVCVTWTLAFYIWILMVSLNFNVRGNVLVEYVCNFFKLLCAVKLNQQGINSPVNSASAPQATQKFPFIVNFRTNHCGSISLTSSNHGTRSLRPRQSDGSTSFPVEHKFPWQQESNECPFNLHLIAEWHFPFQLFALLYPLVLSGNPAGSESDAVSCFHVLM